MTGAGMARDQHEAWQRSLSDPAGFWAEAARAIDWFDVKQGEGRWFLQHATQVKNIWVPYGE